MLLGRRRHRLGHGMHAALGEENAGNGVHVGNDCVDRERVVGRQAGVHRLKRVNPFGAGIGQELAYFGSQFAKTTDREQAREVGGDQIQR